MSANTFDFKLRERELNFDAWWDTSPALPSWLSAANGTALGALPTGMTLTAAGLQSGAGYYQINAGGTEAVNASGRIAVSGLLSYVAKEISFELDGVVMSESRNDADEGPLTSECDYLFFINGGGCGVILEHASTVGGTQLRVVENGATRVVSSNGLELLKFGQGSKPKNLELQIQSRGNNTHAFRLLTGGEEILTVPLNFGDQTANHSVRAAFGITRISGSAAQYMRFEKVRLNVKR